MRARVAGPCSASSSRSRCSSSRRPFVSAARPASCCGRTVPDIRRQRRPRSFGTAATTSRWPKRTGPRTSRAARWSRLPRGRRRASTTPSPVRAEPLARSVPRTLLDCRQDDRLSAGDRTWPSRFYGIFGALVFPPRRLNCRRSLWLETLALLRECGRGRRESGGFLLGRRVDGLRTIEAFLPYDDVDPHALRGRSCSTVRRWTSSGIYAAAKDWRSSPTSTPIAAASVRARPIATTRCYRRSGTSRSSCRTSRIVRTCRAKSASTNIAAAGSGPIAATTPAGTSRSGGSHEPFDRR